MLLDARTLKVFAGCSHGGCRSFLTVALMLIPLCFAEMALGDILNLAVENSVGGKISFSGSQSCRQHCEIEIEPGRVVSLFAVPTKGYRFLSWRGDCQDSVGPFCTLKTRQENQVSAKFIKAREHSRQGRALLLLHDYSDRHSVWNEFARLQFDNRCPVIYGGVILESESAAELKRDACYRIAFGYYNLLSRASAPRENKGISTQALGQEVKAAIIAIINRRPDTKVTLVSQGNAELAVRAFLTSNPDEKQYVAGVLTLQKSVVTNIGGAEVNFIAEGDDGVARLSLAATPKQGFKIATGLERIIGLEKALR